MPDIQIAVLLARFLHIGSVAVMIGGSVYLRFVLPSGMDRARDDDAHVALREARRVRWARLVHICIVLLLASGSFSFVSLVLIPEVDPIPYHPLFVVKFLCSLVVFGIACALFGRSEKLAAMRRTSGRWLNVLLLFAAMILILSAALGQIRAGSGGATVTQATHAQPDPPPR